MDKLNLLLTILNFCFLAWVVQQTIKIRVVILELLPKYMTEVQVMGRELPRLQASLDELRREIADTRGRLEGDHIGGGEL